MLIPNRLPYRWIEPEVLAQALINDWGEDGLIWLDSDNSQLSNWIILAADPINSICVRGLADNQTNNNPFDLLRSLKPGHWTGWLSYEAGAWLEPANPWKESSMTILWMASHDPIFRFDINKRQLWIEGLNEERLEKFKNWLEEDNLVKKLYKDYRKIHSK